MGKHFSSQKLYELRNSIPIDVLIETQLGIPSKISEGAFRFLCPLCNEFQTAVNPKTNLSRCFRCEKNFNTIDLVMTCKGTRFVETVEYLQKIKPQYLKDHHSPQSVSSPFPKGPMLLREIFQQISKSSETI